LPASRTISKVGGKQSKPAEAGSSRCFTGGNGVQSVSHGHKAESRHRTGNVETAASPPACPVIREVDRYATPHRFSLPSPATTELASEAPAGIGISGEIRD
jgi:hypothetical protein